MTIELQCARDCAKEPIFCPCEAGADVQSVLTSDGRRFPAQKTDGGAIVLATLRAGETASATLTNEPCAAPMRLEAKPNRVDFRGESGLFTAYQYDPAFVKPFVGPVFASDGTPFTRPDLHAEEHPHQRSIICAVGDVNGVDFWNEYGNFGFERHAGFTRMEAGAAFARLGARIVWRDKDGAPFVDESRTITCYNQTPDCRYVDLEIVFTASYGEVRFGPTKEAGPLGVRVNEALRADRGGRMTNAYGAVGEKECWSKTSVYCAYEGDIGGKHYGVAVFDNERNERYPTAWHIRDYGLFAANNLYFKGGLTIPAGEKLVYRYRLCFFEGETRLQDRFNNYLYEENLLAKA